MISYLLCFVHLGRHHVHAVGIILHQYVRGMQSLVLPSFDLSAHRQRWGRWVKTLARSRAIRFGEGILGNTASEFVSRDERRLRSPDMGKVVFLSAVHPRQIRDGPTRRPPGLGGQLRDDNRKAA